MPSQFSGGDIPRMLVEYNQATLKHHFDAAVLLPQTGREVLINERTSAVRIAIGVAGFSEAGGYAQQHGVIPPTSMLFSPEAAKGLPPVQDGYFFMTQLQQVSGSATENFFPLVRELGRGENGHHSIGREHFPHALVVPTDPADFNIDLTIAPEGNRVIIGNLANVPIFLVYYS